MSSSGREGIANALYHQSPTRYFAAALTSVHFQPTSMSLEKKSIKRTISSPADRQTTSTEGRTPKNRAKYQRNNRDRSVGEKSFLELNGRKDSAELPSPAVRNRTVRRDPPKTNNSAIFLFFFFFFCFFCFFFFFLFFSPPIATVRFPNRPKPC